MAILHRNIQLMLEFFKAPFLVLHFSYYKYINDLPDVICDITIYADDTTLYSIWYQASDMWQQLEFVSELESDLRDTVDWDKKGFLITVLGKLNWFCLTSEITMVLLMWKCMGLFLLRCLGWSSLLNWIGALALSLLLKLTASKKIGPLIRSIKFLSPKGILYRYKSTIHPCMEYCCHDWAGAPSYYLLLLDKLQKRIWRTVRPSLAASLEHLAHRWNVASLSLLYRYYFGRCSSELAQLVSLHFSRGRSTHYPDRLRDFFVTIPRCFCLCQQFFSLHSYTLELSVYRMLSFDL